MSAFVFCLHRRGKPISKELFAPMMQAINVYGIDGKKQIVKNNFAIGYQRFWTTPEEVGEKQPLQDKETHTWLVFDGRIDNRQEIYALLNNRRHKLESLSDARLFLELYKQTGRKHFKKIVGPFVFVLFNEQSNDVFAGRDAMGGRYLVYKITKDCLVLATFEIAVTAYSEFQFMPDEKRVAEHFAFFQSSQPSTYVDGVIQVQPGFEMIITKSRIDIDNVYLLNPEKRIRFENNKEYAEAFREIFISGIDARLRSISPIASMTSGGMDSLPMSIIAAERLKETNQKLNTVSWVFDKYSESDERKYIEPTVDKYSFNSRYVNCDTAWPLKGGWSVNPAIPFSSPYRTFHNLAYEQFDDFGAKVVLSGMSGDNLYVGFEYQLYELMQEGLFLDAASEFMRRRKALNSTMQCLKIHFLWSTALYNVIKAKISNKIPIWLTSFAKQYLNNDAHWLYDDAQKALRPNQYLSLLGGG